ncbi:MFS transporter [Clostridium sp. YIM B02515]|uniref:MFS transporter n=1 Tax=Clostridium rhizosphaerae TaxID=2803861 RepID=A0ABS1T991_9CLOT|nr:MFS transporter [Clostridium rhizosphaerae]MBL4935910.1 MFS transporter [Clostridium rhizosphaerae]
MENKNNQVNSSRWIILFTILMMTFMSTLDSSIVNVALPAMSKHLNVSMASIEWVVTSYLIIISASILMFGRLGDIKGKTKVFKFGIILFTFGSLLCGISNSLVILVASRVIQAIGAAASMATSQGIVTHVFPSNERGRALGLTGTFVALGSMVGPPLGGFIITVLSWKYIFLINVPIGILSFTLGMKTLPKEMNKLNEKLDFKGTILFAASIVLIFGSLTQGQNTGYNNPAIITGFVLAIVSMAAFLIVEKKISMPLLDLEIFKNKLFSLSIFCGFVTFIAIGSSNIIQPFYLQDVKKLSPGTTGLIMMVYPIVLSVVAPVSGYISDKIGSEFLTFIGLLISSTGLLLMSTLTQSSYLWILIIFVGAMALGNGLFQSPNNSLIMSTVPKHKLGIAGSVNALVRNLGMVLGVSLSTTLLYNRMSYKIGYRVVNYVENRDDVFVYGMKYVYIAAASICFIGAILTAYRLYGSKIKNKKMAIDTINK